MDEYERLPARRVGALDLLRFVLRDRRRVGGRGFGCGGGHDRHPPEGHVRRERQVVGRNGFGMTWSSMRRAHPVPFALTDPQRAILVMTGCPATLPRPHIGTAIGLEVRLV